jgi:hypothetical protein
MAKQDENYGDAPLADYCTADILRDYKALVEDFGPEDDLVKEMREILVSRHRYLSLEEMANVSHDWHGAHCDQTQYTVSANMIFEVDGVLYDFYGSMDGCLRQQVPIGMHTISADTVYQYLIGFQVTFESLPWPSLYVERSKAKQIIATLLAKVPDGTS